MRRHVTNILHAQAHEEIRMSRTLDLQQLLFEQRLSKSASKLATCDPAIVSSHVLRHKKPSTQHTERNLEIQNTNRTLMKKMVSTYNRPNKTLHSRDRPVCWGAYPQVNKLIKQSVENLALYKTINKAQPTTPRQSELAARLAKNMRLRNLINGRPNDVTRIRERAQREILNKYGATPARKPLFIACGMCKDIKDATLGGAKAVYTKVQAPQGLFNVRRSASTITKSQRPSTAHVQSARVYTQQLRPQSSKVPRTLSQSHLQSPKHGKQADTTSASSQLRKRAGSATRQQPSFIALSKQTTSDTVAATGSAKQLRQRSRIVSQSYQVKPSTRVPAYAQYSARASVRQSSATRSDSRDFTLFGGHRGRHLRKAKKSTKTSKFSVGTHTDASTKGTVDPAHLYSDKSHQLLA